MLAGYAHVPIGSRVEQVKNFNENHDERGRFAESDGSGGGGSEPKSKGHIGFTDTHEYFEGPGGDIYRAQKSDYIGTDGYRAGARFESTKTGWQSLKTRVPFKNTMGGRAVTNPPYVTPDLGDAPDEMKTQADKLYKDLRTNQYSSESEEDKAAAAGTMWKILKSTWKKGKDGKWVKKAGK